MSNALAFTSGTNLSVAETTSVEFYCDYYIDIFLIEERNEKWKKVLY